MTENEVAIIDQNDLVDQAVQHINEIANKSVYSGMMEIGRYVLEKFFDNDVKKTSSKTIKTIINPPATKIVSKR